MLPANHETWSLILQCDRNFLIVSILNVHPFVSAVNEYIKYIKKWESGLEKTAKKRPMSAFVCPVTYEIKSVNLNANKPMS